MNALIFLGLLKVYAKLSAGECKSFRCLRGKTVLLTGANSGIGYETAATLASRGCKLILADVIDSSDKVKKLISDTNNEKISYKHLDLASLQSVRALAEDINKNESRLDILINNAGCGGFCGKFTSDGLLKVMQVNHLGPFLLTHLLANLLKKTPDSRVVFLNSIMAFLHSLHTGASINKIKTSRNELITSTVEYANSSLCSLATARCFGERLAKDGVVVNSVYPGFIDTPFHKTWFANMNSKKISVKIFSFILSRIVFIYGKTPLEGAQTTLHCALSSDVFTAGRYYVDCMAFMHPTLVQINSFNWQVWEESEKLVKIKPAEKI